MKHITFIIFSIVFVILSSCNNPTTEKYLADIGDTTFNTSKDKSTFKFCDSSNVLHKRAYIKYKGGIRNFEDDLISQYQIKPEYTKFSGYFIVRFAVNCKNEAGRFRWEIVNPDFEKTTCPKGLENEIITTLKRLDKWNHPVYRGKNYDGYTYLVIKIEKGEIIKS